MASERDIELLDDYLANRLDPGARASFENRLNTDPNLRSEFELQQQFIRGIRQARIAELKTMMNNIPVPPASTGAGIGLKAALLGIVAGAVGTALYLYLDKTEEAPSTTPKTEQVEPRKESQPETEMRSDDNSAVVPQEPSSGQNKPVEAPEPVETNEDPKIVTSDPPQPHIDVFDPSEISGEENSVLSDVENIPMRSRHNTAIEVAVESGNRKYDFHYQFKDGKLFLYGPFEENLYEILEIFSEEKRTLFLFHNDRYYYLKETSDKLTPLKAIEEATLIRKLNEYRN